MLRYSMPIRTPESEHDSPTQPEAATAKFRRSSEDESRAEVKAEPTRPQPTEAESPSADRMTGANGPLHQPDPEANPAGDQDIDTAGTDADDQSPTKAMGTGMAPTGREVELMADQGPNKDRQDRNLEVPGDTNSADIVGRTGEQMPLQSHDGLEAEERQRRTRRERRKPRPGARRRRQSARSRRGLIGSPHGK